MSEQEGKLLDHDYDGIQELDNPLPRWWVYLFYITVVFAVIYFVYYVFGYGDSVATKHEKAVKALTQTSEAAQVTMLFDASRENLSEGQRLYVAKCAACHKADGGGLVGPNLTDAYWLHGDASNDAIYQVIHDGVPEKGMIAWKSQLSPDDIQNITVYIQSLKNSSPANAKGPEGNLID